MIDGVLNIDKPAGVTSHDAVDHVRRLAGQRRVGHGGTLDPFATGVLLVLLGQSTKLMPEIQKLPKTYELEITLGGVSNTDDITGVITTTDPSGRLRRPPPLRKGRQDFRISPPYEGGVAQRAGVVKILKQFTGQIMQIPPAYAAIKVKGKKLYEYAREGKTVERKPRLVMIYSIDLLGYQYPKLRLKIMCGSGTYMRSLARDIGEQLGRGGYASALRRTAVGSYTLDQALPFSKLVLQWPNATNQSSCQSLASFRPPPGD